MDNIEVEEILRKSLIDFKLDNRERNLLGTLSRNLTGDKIGFIKNKAFEISRPIIERGGVDSIKVLNWLERVIKAVHPVTLISNSMSEAFFSPGDECRNNIIRLIQQAKVSLEICVFTISDNRITESILASYEKGIDISIISDNDKANDRGSDISYLVNKGVNVILDHSPYHMHHKFMLVDNKILLNGSFNWTRSASDNNEENIVITTDQDLVLSFSQKFTQLKHILSQ